MKYWETLFLAIGLLGATFLAIGLWKPWIMLWWKETQNRRKVFQLYGSVALISLLLYFMIKHKLLEVL